MHFLRDFAKLFSFFTWTIHSPFLLSSGEGMGRNKFDIWIFALSLCVETDGGEWEREICMRERGNSLLSNCSSSSSSSSSSVSQPSNKTRSVGNFFDECFGELLSSWKIKTIIKITGPETKAFLQKGLKRKVKFLVKTKTFITERN